MVRAVGPWHTTGPVGLREHPLGNVGGVRDAESAAWTLAVRLAEDAVRLLARRFDETTPVAMPWVDPARNATPAASVGRRLRAAQVDGAIA